VEADLLRKHTKGFFAKGESWKEQLLAQIDSAVNTGRI
jgi:hypothetical protein